MFELVVLSGKGGTGKTSITAAFAHLASHQITCDLDVDAPDLHLLLSPDYERTEQFYSGHQAVINAERCEPCGTCVAHCRFDAIDAGGDKPRIDPLKCEGCKVCVHFCPADAIDFNENHCGEWHVSETKYGPMVHAQLFPGEENSGRLVALLRQQAKAVAREKGRDIILSDGPPGIGCPVISSLSGADLAVIVTEPTPSGRHDLERVMALCDHFKVATSVIINKFDINPSQEQEIESLCSSRNTPVLAKLPHDNTFIHSMISAQPITAYRANGLTERIRNAWKKIEEIIHITQEKKG